jgi:hypothetical protein
MTIRKGFINPGRTAAWAKLSCPSFYFVFKKEDRRALKTQAVLLPLF